MLLPLAYAGEEILYQKAKEVPVKDIQNAKIQTFLNDMADTMNSIDIAAGLAAPQLKKSLRIFGIKLGQKSLTYTQLSPKNDTPLIKPLTPFFFINPKLSPVDEIKETKAEACLSIPNYFGLVERYASIKVSAYTREGIPFTLIATKFLARVIQHEYDHLDGILWFQRVKSARDIYYDNPNAQEVEEIG